MLKWAHSYWARVHGRRCVLTVNICDFMTWHTCQEVRAWIGETPTQRLQRCQTICVTSMYSRTSTWNFSRSSLWSAHPADRPRQERLSSFIFSIKWNWNVWGSSLWFENFSVFFLKVLFEKMSVPELKKCRSYRKIQPVSSFFQCVAPVASKHASLVLRKPI